MHTHFHVYPAVHDLYIYLFENVCVLTTSFQEDRPRQKQLQVLEFLHLWMSSDYCFR